MYVYINNLKIAVENNLKIAVKSINSRAGFAINLV